MAVSLMRVLVEGSILVNPTHDAPHLSDLAQLRADAAVGRALRETVEVAPEAPRVHISWITPSGKSTGRWLVDHPLYAERVAYAEAAQDLYEAAAEYAGESTP